VKRESFDEKADTIDIDTLAVPRIAMSTWCVECRKGSPATRIYHGDGLCEAHFAEKVGRV
jgi:hypothetical protein